MTDTTRKLDTPSNSLVARMLDSVDRGHAAAAARVHDLRNRTRDALCRGLDRIEAFTSGAIGAARKRIARADELTADAIIRTQGRIGSVLERARHEDLRPAHAIS